MPRRFTGSLAVALIAAATGAAGCASSASPSGSASASASGASASASPTAAANYWPTLNAINAKLAADIGQLRSARTPTAVSSAVTAAEADVYLDFYRLVGITPPSGLQTTQYALVSALRVFRGDLTTTGSAADADEVCAGSSALEMLSNSAGASQLRSTEAQLANVNPTAGARTGSFLPPATPYTHRRLPDGTMVKRAARSGLGQLTIRNNNNQDAVVSLVLGHSTVATMALYVRARSSATTTGVTDGAYQVYYTTGADWDRSEHLFTRYCDFEKLNKNIDFTTSVSDYTTEQVTLNSIFAGNVTASRVPADKFPAP